MDNLARVKCPICTICGVVYLTKIVLRHARNIGLNVSGGCYTYSIRKLEKVSKLERVKMTNRIYEQGLTPTAEALMGYTACERGCGRVTAHTVCVMCK